MKIFRGWEDEVKFSEFVTSFPLPFMIKYSYEITNVIRGDGGEVGSFCS